MTNSLNRLSKGSNLSEGLRRSDLKDTIDYIFTVDQYQSKMGDDSDVLVIRFRASGKEPAVDLMEFIEKGYPFVLDADMSSGEEKDGKYSVFVELERNEDAPNNVEDLLNGINQLADISSWRFRWYKDIEGHTFDPETFAEVVPLTPEEYEMRSEEFEGEDAADEIDVEEFFNQGAMESIDVDLDRKIITFNKPYAEPLTLEFHDIGSYNTIKDKLPGGIQLDESSRGQVLYLNKYLGNYDINKIADKFLVRNGNYAVILSKKTW